MYDDDDVKDGIWILYECNYHHKMHFITQKNYDNGNMEEHQQI